MDNVFAGIRNNRLIKSMSPKTVELSRIDGLSLPIEITTYKLPDGSQQFTTFLNGNLIYDDVMEINNRSMRADFSMDRKAKRYKRFLSEFAASSLVLSNLTDNDRSVLAYTNLESGVAMLRSMVEWFVDGCMFDVVYAISIPQSNVVRFECSSGEQSDSFLVDGGCPVLRVLCDCLASVMYVTSVKG